MIVRLFLLTAVLALACAPAAWAQHDEEDIVDEPEVTATPTPIPELCDRPPGSDADYVDCAYNLCDRPIGTGDGDYAYCPTAAHGPVDEGGAVKPRPTVRALPAGTLPVTGADALLLGLTGFGFLLAGLGLRLRLSAAGRPPSS